MIDDDFGSSNGSEDGPEVRVSVAADSENFDQNGTSNVPFGDDLDDQTGDEFDPAAARREGRRRQRMIEGLAKSFGIADEAALETMELIDELIPDAARMSTSEHVAVRLEHATLDLRKRHPKLLFNREGKGLDVTDVKRNFLQTKAFADLLDDEEGLLRAVIINDQLRVGLERWVAQHEAVRSLLLAEYVRRSTLVEQWRHLIPKYMLPVFSMLEASGAKALDVRIHSRLFNRIRDVLVEWSGGAVSKADLVSAAQRTEDEFLGVLKDNLASVDKAQPSVPEPFEVARERLHQAIEQLKEELVELDDDDDGAIIQKASDRLHALSILVAQNAGLDRQGRPVFASIGAFAETAKSNSVSAEAGADRIASIEGEDEFGPEIPEDLFDPEGDDNGDEVPDGAALETTEEDGVVQAGKVPGQDEEDLHPASVWEAQEQSVEAAGGEALPSEDEGIEDDEQEPILIPAGSGVFSPDRVKEWPKDMIEVRRLLPSLPRSTGLSRSLGSTPFDAWRPITERPPFCFMGFRYQPDLSFRDGVEGPIIPADIARPELASEFWRCDSYHGVSPVLGQGHVLMIPPHSSLAWYGRKLGWSENDVRHLSAFGSPAKPETLKPKGDPKKLIDAFRGVADLRLRELAREKPGHILAAEAKRVTAVEDIARWWLFLMVVRHHPEEFEIAFPGDFFQGVQGPDFILDDSNEPVFGETYIRMWHNRVNHREAKEDDASLGLGQPYRGIRRRFVGT